MPSLAVRQNWQLTAQPICEETQMVARRRAGVASVVVVLGAVAVGHPDGLDGLIATGADEVALGAVDGAEGLEDGRKTDRVAFGGELFAQGEGQGGDGVEVGDPVAVEGLGELAGAEVWLAEVRN